MLTLDSWRRRFQFRLPSTRLLARTLYAAGLLLGLLISGAHADASKNTREFQLAAAFQLPQLPQIPGLSFADRAIGGLAAIRFVFHLCRKALR
jgi:hypothetical protein